MRGTIVQRLWLRAFLFSLGVVFVLASSPVAMATPIGTASITVLSGDTIVSDTQFDFSQGNFGTSAGTIQQGTNAPNPPAIDFLTLSFQANSGPNYCTTGTCFGNLFLTLIAPDQQHLSKTVYTNPVGYPKFPNTGGPAQIGIGLNYTDYFDGETSLEGVVALIDFQYEYGTQGDILGDFLDRLEIVFDVLDPLDDLQILGEISYNEPVAVAEPASRYLFPVSLIGLMGLSLYYRYRRVA